MVSRTLSADRPQFRLGILGCGNIATILARHALDIEVITVFDRHPDRAANLTREWNADACQDFEAFINHDMDSVLEIASIEAVEDYAESILRHHKQLILLSVGALADKALHTRLIDTALQHQQTIRIPSGALFGLDNIKIGRIASFDKLILRTTKPAASLGVKIQTRQRLFHGTATDCIRHYPRDVNVAVALSLAADQEVTIELWADPDARHNNHEILVSGAFGQGELKVTNLPCPDNPATSYLAALSLIALLNSLNDVLLVGT